MSCLLRIFWLSTLLIFVSGCSGYKTVCYTRSEGSTKADQDVDPEIAETCDLKPGEKVRINLLDGERTVGDIQFISPLEIVIYDEDHYFQPRTFTADQIRSIERPAPSSSTGTVIVLTIAGLLIIGGLVVANMDFDVMDN